MISHSQHPPANLNGYNPSVFSGEYWYSHDDAQLAVDFIERQCCHIKGRLAGSPLVMEDWQTDFVRTLFGWKRKDGTRRYRHAFVFLPRKNGKTIMLAAVANLMMFCPRFKQPGAELYCAASSRDQASLLFDVAAGMVRHNPLMNNRCKIVKSYKRIVQGDSFFRALPAEAGTAHGFNGSLICCDELHAWEGERGREFYDVLQTSTGAREEPLSIDITTAGYDKQSVCHEQFQRALNVRDNPEYDEAFLPVLYFTEESDDWTDPKVWSKANPNLGISIGEDYLARECEKAKQQPIYENVFRRLHLNQWTESVERWLPKWDENTRLEARHSQWVNFAKSLHNKPCWGGLDLSATSDLTAFVLAFSLDGGRVAFLPHFWIPSEKIRQRSRRDGVPYDAWASHGWINVIDGEAIDYDIVRRDIAELHMDYDIREIAYDRWGAPQLRQQLEGDGLNMVEFGQGFASMSPPSKELERLLIDCKIEHSNHPALNWCAANVVAEIDAAGNIKPSKKKSTERIDGIVAAVMALSGVMNSGQGESIYNTYGMLTGIADE